MTATTKTATTAQQFPTRFLQIAGGRIAYDDTADTAVEATGANAARRPVVVCTPGLGDNRTSFRHLRPLLVEAGYRVVTMDLRGEGDSTAVWDDYSTTAMAGRHPRAGPSSRRRTGGVAQQLLHRRAVVPGHGAGP